MNTPRPKKKINPMLLNVIIISALVHVVALVILGGITVVKYIIPDDAEFEEPPVMEEMEPPPEVKVMIKPPVKEPPLNKLTIKQVGNIAIKDLSVDLPTMGDSFTVSSGLGGTGGLGGGIGSGRGFEMKMPEMNFFGAKSTGEKVIFIVHFGPATTNQGKKSTPYTRMTAYVIRKRLEELIQELPPVAMFNVAAFWARHCTPFSEQMLVANDANKQLLLDWMAPVNPVEGTNKTYGSSFGKFGDSLVRTPWPEKVTTGLPSYGPAWYYNFVTPKSVEEEYFGTPVPKDATNHWGRGLFWALTTQKPDTIYVLTTNYLPNTPDHPQQVTKAYRKIVSDLYELNGLKPPTVNVVVLANAGTNPAKAQKVLDQRFAPLIRASRGRGSVIDNIERFMTPEERKRLDSYAK